MAEVRRAVGVGEQRGRQSRWHEAETGVGGAGEDDRRRGARCDSRGVGARVAGAAAGVRCPSRLHACLHPSDRPSAVLHGPRSIL